MSPLFVGIRYLVPFLLTPLSGRIPRGVDKERRVEDRKKRCGRWRGRRLYKWSVTNLFFLSIKILLVPSYSTLVRPPVLVTGPNIKSRRRRERVGVPLK